MGVWIGNSEMTLIAKFACIGLEHFAYVAEEIIGAEPIPHLAFDAVSEI